MTYTNEQITELLSKISPCPWRAEINENGELVIHIDDSEQNAVIWCGDMETCTGRDMHNHEFIAAAPEIVRQLLEELEFLQGRTASLEQENHDLEMDLLELE